MRSFFDPSSQHRDWCPWVNPVEGGEALEDTTTQTEKEPAKAEPGWQVVLNTLLATRKCDRVPETEPVVSLQHPQPQTRALKTLLAPALPGAEGLWVEFGVDGLRSG